MRTPLGKVRGLGSARSGAEHFWLQRVTAVANLVLAIFLIWFLARHAGASHGEVRAALASPLVAVPLLLLILSGMVHMRLGMQVVIEDYVKGDVTKLVALMLNTFFSFGIGLLSIFAVLKLGLGA
ncbi:MAG: succinate dehydrogenase, hydrophobic membrane anchor protein [Rhizobiales bacterium]|nr:succinate dehydrogenase, hydrophobic membrane anchor protein [Hyphomicrobiales bacterium]